MSELDKYYINIKNNFNKKLNLAYKNYFTKLQIYDLIKNKNKNDNNKEKKDKSYFESLIFNRIKSCSKNCTGYSEFTNEELKNYEPVIYDHISYISEIIDIINNRNKEIIKTNPKIKKTHKYFIYNNLKFERDDRINFLYNFAKNNLKKHNKKLSIAKKLVVLLLLQYTTLGISGQQCSLSYSIYNYFYNNLNVKGEGFSSPLNSKLIEKEDSIICSIFFNVDKYFKSQGLYSPKIINENNKFNWLLNPPFLTSAIKTSINSIIDVLEKPNKMIVIFVLPFTKVKFQYKLLNNKYLYGLINQTHIYITSDKAQKKEKIERINNKQYFICNGKYSSNFENIIMYFYTNFEHNSVNLLEHMKKISDLWSSNNIEEDIQQSNFKEPILL